MNRKGLKNLELEIIERHKGEFTISTDINKLELSKIHNYLANEADWSANIPIDTLAISIENSLNFGLFFENKQIGFARIISDYATIAYLGDVYILEEFRGNGLSKWLMSEVMAHPKLQGLRRWILLTDTAEWLYKKFGFTALPKPEVYMEKHNPNVYNHLGESL
ncbi:GNAT family N-acetyltransferase [Aurantibacter sp.]|uniref:GNAT family N-acetyltransferase n=1 Tax=Aurantibacter sp. TaxID=2807103 RepID=UPI0032669FA8